WWSSRCLREHLCGQCRDAFTSGYFLRVEFASAGLHRHQASLAGRKSAERAVIESDETGNTELGGDLDILRGEILREIVGAGMGVHHGRQALALPQLRSK